MKEKKKQKGKKEIIKMFSGKTVIVKTRTKATTTIAAVTITKVATTLMTIF